MGLAHHYLILDNGNRMVYLSGNMGDMRHIVYIRMVFAFEELLDNK